MPVPIPGNPLGYTLVYAIESPRGPVLIDAGWNHPDAWEALSDGFAALGIDVADVYGVVVTHFHPDHAGLAGQVREVSGAWIAMHEADAAIVTLMRGLADDEHRDFQAEMLRRAGAEGLDVSVAVAERPVPPAQPDRTLRDGDIVDVPGRGLRAIHTPGHTPGHLCLRLEDRLFTGDHVLPDITPHVGIYPYDRTDVDPLGDFLKSLEKVAEQGPLTALPAHEWIFPDVGARALQIRHHHEERLHTLATLLTSSGEPLTIWEIAAMMTWNRAWDDLSPMLRGLAAGEAAAHLRTLEARGEIRRVSGVDPVRFQALDS
ncbi:MBL fold metallo-hydrolase [Nonomuraea endophytica]|uniref:Glyoxylase-like metal-dependent hydrolase (Beta-lactamase superfamily II) n=1 Tax=Nonomuraea endophytica TaxID=714136 RepID=A0A7W8AC80_9ACTN|nr:MBL fold metallo-hydrolase [Nonomuraea endophytica]MBB5083497.1 glyoxylase-like metal-dependent hydrolase (beta-lactamase superfamily II) [Nonomuraea endophytica]